MFPDDVFRNDFQLYYAIPAMLFALSFGMSAITVAGGFLTSRWIWLASLPPLYSTYLWGSMLLSHLLR